MTEANDTLPCGHTEFYLVSRHKDALLIRCISCRRLWVVFLTDSPPGYHIVKVETVFSVQDIAPEEDLQKAENWYMEVDDGTKEE